MYIYIYIYIYIYQATLHPTPPATKPSMTFAPDVDVCSYDLNIIITIMFSTILIIYSNSTNSQYIIIMLTLLSLSIL